jgi:transposase-like protein
MTTRPQRIEVITRSERRRRWPLEAKREIVAESLEPGVRPSEIIHKHGITSSQLYAWRQQLTRRVEGELAQPAANFARVAIVAETPEVKAMPAPGTQAAPLTRSQVQAPLITASRSKGLIETVLPGGISVRVDAHVDDRALRCVLGALRER